MLATSRPSPAEPVTRLRHVRIMECGEELVDFLAICPGLTLDAPRFKYRRETLLRRRVAEMLCDAACRLPAAYRLLVIEGWRPPYIQHRMYRTVWGRFEKANPGWSKTKLVRTVNRFTAPIDPRVPPPHTTGGAVDVILGDSSGKPMDHCSPFEQFDSNGFGSDARGLSPTARETRQILSDALLAAGLTNYPSEYWHWSYGDQGWAYRGGYPHALYGPVQPPNWQPAPEDQGDLPLERT